MILVTSVIGVLGMVILPIVLGFWLTRKFKLSWKLWLVGAVTFIASQVLAKHDENYMPPEAAEALRKAGHPVGVPEQFVDKARASVQK